MNATLYALAIGVFEDMTGFREGKLGVRQEEEGGGGIQREGLSSLSPLWHSRVRGLIIVSA